MQDLDTLIVPGLTHWQASNRFFAYFKAHSSYPAVLGEMVCAGLNVMGFDWIASPACTELEVVVLEWLARLLHLPSKFLGSEPGPGGGVIQGSAGEAAIVALLGAIRQVEAAKGFTPRQDMVVFCSDQTHTIIEKAALILGIGYREVGTHFDDGLRLRGASLREAVLAVLADGRIPIAAVATPGTTSACSFDAIDEVALVCEEFKMWLHVDAAYGGAYACLPELRHKFVGVEKADSFVVNCHKKLLCPFDIAALFLADRRPVIEALSVHPEYLKNCASDSGAVVDFEHWQLPLGRRFRALKLWFVLRRYGEEGIRQHIRNGVSLANHFSKLVEESRELELAAPVSLSLVCFRLQNREEDVQQSFLAELRRGGQVFLIHTRLGGKFVIRFACGGIEQSFEDVTAAFHVIRDVATRF